MLNTLSINTIFKDKYKILKVLGQGGFGITYLVEHTRNKHLFAIKELFLNGYCTRQNTNVVPTIPVAQFQNYKNKFLEEADMLFRFRNEKGVVQVIDDFEENQTAYFVMEYVKGEPLASYVRKKGQLSEQETITLTLQILDILEKVHQQNILHRDLKPDNILIDEQGKPVLIDFGIAREYQENITLTQTNFLTPAYSPPEQYANRDKRGAYTDIYTLGGVMFFMLTGKSPQNCMERMLEDVSFPKKMLPSVSDFLNNCVVKAMKLKPQERFQNCVEMKKYLKRENIVYGNQRIVFQTGNKFGFKDEFGNIVISCIYDATGLFMYNFLLVNLGGTWHPLRDGGFYFEQNGKWGVIDKMGNTLIPFDYEHIGVVFHGERFVVSKKNGSIAEYAMLDRNNHQIIPFGVYSYIRFDFIGKYLLVAKNKESGWGYVDVWGNQVISCRDEWTEAYSFIDEFALIRKGEYYGFINELGETAIPFIFDGKGPNNTCKASTFQDGLAIVSNEGRIYYINKKGEYVKDYN